MSLVQVAPLLPLLAKGLLFSSPDCLSQRSYNQPISLQWVKAPIFITTYAVHEPPRLVAVKERKKRPVEP